MRRHMSRFLSIYLAEKLNDDGRVEGQPRLWRGPPAAWEDFELLRCPLGEAMCLIGMMCLHTTLLMECARGV